MNNQKVRIGVDRLFYAKLLGDTESSVLYGAPVALPGVTNIGLTLNHSLEAFWSDDAPDEFLVNDGVKELKMSSKGLSAAVYADLMGAAYSSTNGLQKDGKMDNPPFVAVGFRAQKTSGEYRYVWVYKGKFSKPDSSKASKTATTTAQTDELTYKAIPRVYDGNWRQMLDSDDENIPSGLNAALLNDTDAGWFSSPDYIPVSQAGAISDLAGVAGAANGEIDITFSAPTEMTNGKGKVQARDAALGTWHDVATAVALTAASASATIIGLTPGNSYELRLVIKDGSKAGISNVVTVSAKTGV